MGSDRAPAVPRRIVLAVLAVLAAAALRAAAGFEAVPTFEAAKVLPAAQVKGPHHTIEARVPLVGLYRQYKITSDYGAFGADGDLLLLIRLKEVDALARLAETSEAEVALKAVGGAMGGAVKGAANAVANPVETVAGIPEGVGKMFGRVGRKAKRTAEKGKEEVKGDSKPSDADSKSTGEAAADARARPPRACSASAPAGGAGRRSWASIPTPPTPCWARRWTRSARSTPPAASPPSWSPAWPSSPPWPPSTSSSTPRAPRSC
jgi:hypothetical protein